MTFIPILEICIALIVIFIVFSVLTSAVADLLNTWLNIKGKFVHNFLNRILSGDDNIIKELYQHPAIKILHKKLKLADSIPKDTFVNTLLEVIAKSSGGTVNLKDITAAIANLPAGNLKEILTSLLDDGLEKIDEIKERIGQWYDEISKLRSRWYKEHLRLILFGIGLVLAVGMNVDVLHITKELHQNNNLRQQLNALGGDWVENKPQFLVQLNDSTVNIESSATTPTEAEENHELVLKQQRVDSLLYEVSQLSLPIGWEMNPKSTCFIKVDIYETGNKSHFGWLGKILGWLLAAGAFSLGAPFWYDVLRKAMNFKNNLKSK